MKVSTRVHYGLRAMTELARSYRNDRLLSIAEIARSEGLPLAYLEQLVGALERLNEIFAAGYAAEVTDAVKSVGGKEPTTFEQFARDYAKAFKG